MSIGPVLVLSEFIVQYSPDTAILKYYHNTVVVYNPKQGVPTSNTFNSLVPKMFSAATSSKGIRRYISVMAAVKFAYFSITEIMFC